MKDQILDPNGKPIAPPNPTFDAAVMPIMDATTGRLYIGISKPELYSAMLFAHRFNTSLHQLSDGSIARLASDCCEAAKILYTKQQEILDV